MFPFVRDFIFNVKYAFSQMTLFSFKFGNIPLQAVLLGHGGGLAAAALKVADGSFHVIQFLLGHHFHIFSPLIQLVPGFSEMPVIFFEVFGNGRLKVSFSVRQ